MMKKHYSISAGAYILSLAILILTGCTPSWEDSMIISGSGLRDMGISRVESGEKRKVLLLYSAGYNNLRDYLREDIEELKEGMLPKDGRSDDVVLVYTHSSKTAQDYVTSTTPYLIRLYSDADGTVVSDTLVTYPDNTISSSAAQLNAVLDYVRRNFNAKSYGMVFSSHATGFLPSGYYSRPTSYTFIEKGSRQFRLGQQHIPGPVEIDDVEYDPSRLMVKSVGADYSRVDSRLLTYEMEIGDFADAIPMKLDYILFDACLMGGVEIAYELRGKCDHILASQAEVLAWGLNYKTLTSHLLGQTEPNPQGVGEDFIEQYENMSGASRSATISLISTEHIEGLAAVCAPLIDKYREAIQNTRYTSVQGFGGSKYYFFDLVDVIRYAGATDEEIHILQDAMDKVVPYKSTTGQYYSVTDESIHQIEDDKFSGLTMYMPRKNITELDKYYRTLSWNKATGLVE